MTTEIAVMNRLGVALATDSAVTISSGGKTKIYNSAEKLFELSNTHPVGVMVNGNPDFMGVPWELLIKDFRTQHGAVARSTVNAWMEDLIAFIDVYSGLEDSISVSHLEEIAEDEIISIQSNISFRIEKALSETNKSKRIVDVNDVTAFFADAIKERRKEINEFGRADSLRDVSQHEIMVAYAPILDRMLKRRFLPYQLEQHEIENISENIVEALLSKKPSDYTAGIVVAGFGSGNLYPEVTAMDVTAKVAGRLKTSDKVLHNVDGVNDAGRVMTFAQT